MSMQVTHLMVWDVAHEQSEGITNNKVHGVSTYKRSIIGAFISIQTNLEAIFFEFFISISCMAFSNCI